MNSLRFARPALALSAVLLLAAPAVAATAAPARKSAAKPATPAHSSAPFWTGHPDAPRFAKIQEERIAKAKAEIARMKAVKGKRTVQNTLVPYDEASIYLDSAGNQAGLIESVHPDSNLRAAAEKSSQDVSAYGTEISLDREVYQALQAMDLTGADDETRFYVERELRDFRLAGVDKDDAARARIKELRDELVKIGQEFDRNIRDDVRTVKAKPGDLEGLPKDYVDGHPVGADGLITLDINYPDYVPVMTYATNDDLRRRMYMEFNNRAYPKNEEVLKRLLVKRYELAQVLGFSNWADYITANKMAGNAKTVRDFIDKIVGVSGAAQTRDYQTLLAQKKKDQPGATAVNAWESGMLSEAVRRSDYDFDSQSMRPYLPYAAVKQGMLEITSRLFGVTFKAVPNAPVWHPSVDCYELFEGNKLVGRIYLDMHPRPNKFNHAAEFDVRTGVQGKQIPEATLVCNLPGGEAGDPGLCEINDVQTFLHEFGHLLHAMFAGHRQWLGVSGIRTEHDFVEAPSQMLEEWMKDPKTLQTFAKHHQTGEPVPTELVNRMRRADEFAKGMQVRRQMVYADLSLSIYDRDPAQVDVNAMAKSLVEKYQPFAFVDGTHFPDSFGHLDGYSAVYYTYMWSLVIAKDMFSAFNPDNLLDPTIAGRYRKTVLTPGGSAPAAKLVENFLGRPFGFDSYQRWLDAVN